MVATWGPGLQKALCMLMCALLRGHGPFTAFSPQPSQPQDLGSGQVSLFSLFLLPDLGQTAAICRIESHPLPSIRFRHFKLKMRSSC